MHFVYKNWTISFGVFRFLTKLNSSVMKAFQFFKLITTPDFLCIQYASFKATPSTFNHFCLHLIFFMHLMICFELNDLEIEKHYKWTLKKLKLDMVSSFHPHRLFKKVERVMAKTGCTSFTNWTISFEVLGFRTKTHLLQKGFHFLTCNCNDILDQSHHQNSCGEKVFTFSSLVSFAYWRRNHG